ncbi:MBL fold metallo-hydrolase [Alkalilimnicola ehrlichii MLHE-1]|uniref:Metal-dependent hydrolases of the beta-lactamase superfamily III-like protein n=1 Tax=Alkalilimnicola ehrlichii (strain ATCC BAA-1101 / DSM 17681 / MLHE-1) TaxID=187272 RepID=Q0A7X5_ALKEH|nr:MBL fold metallo-hydrolase [Alkalilimnicola ehrlichii]ABI57062.1 Metal-dependent hydrolases of the beta-lactamase superfamily III-like protein [Alkalilimnicola ehrlichii MLHE-1]
MAASGRPEPQRRPGAAPGPALRVGQAEARLLNGVLGDPLLHLRLHHQRRSLLFDLGEGSRLSARIAHQVSDVFISHAHMDHICGLLWLLRSRIGPFPACRLYGPPGLAGHVQGMVNAVLWDRVGERAPGFEVLELHEGDRLLRAGVRAGRRAPMPLAPRRAPDGYLLAEPQFRVRGRALDHGTPVLAFAYEPPRQLNVRKERLAARGWPPGPWLGELRRRVLAGDRDGDLALPDGRRWPVERLAAELLLERPGQRLVYATDLADTPTNRQALVSLARGGAYALLRGALSPGRGRSGRPHRPPDRRRLRSDRRRGRGAAVGALSLFPPPQPRPQGPDRGGTRGLWRRGGGAWPAPPILNGVARR